MAHFAGRLDPASILLHRHGDLPIMHIQAQIQDPLAIAGLICLILTTARYCSVIIFHTSRQFTAGAVCCRLMSSKICNRFAVSPTVRARPAFDTFNV